MRTLRLAACLLAAIAVPALAQDKPDGAWRGSLTFGLSLSHGNSTSRSVNLGADAVRATEDDKITLNATALGGESDASGETKKTAELVKASGRYDRNLGSRTFVFGSLALEHDGLQRLDLRSGLGAGLGYHVIKRDDATFDLFGGLGYTREDFEIRKRNFAEVLLGEESSHRLSRTATFKQRLAIFPNLEDSGEYRAELDATIAASINAAWSLKVTLTNRYFSNPLPGLGKTDTILLVGLSGKFGPE